MKRTIKFSKLFVPCIILSGVLMIFSILGFYFRGINFGLDFQAGFIEKVRIAPTAFTLSYEGTKTKTVTLSLNSAGLDLTTTEVGGGSEVMSFPYSRYETMGAFIEGLQNFEGLKVKLMDGVAPETRFANLFVDSQISPRLSETPYKVHYIPKDAKVVTSDDIRNALKEASLPSDAVQQVGKAEDGIFQIRLPDDGSDERGEKSVAVGDSGKTEEELSERTDGVSVDAIDETLKVNEDVAGVENATESGSDAGINPEKQVAEKVENEGNSEDNVSSEKTEENLVATSGEDTKNEESAKGEEMPRVNTNARLQASITKALNNAFGEDNIVVLSTDFVGSRFSTSLARQAVVLVLGALCLIFLYAMVRFRWDFALGGILALLHDTLAIFAFIVWTQMEFNSISIAAVLTIIGYSINDTVVIFDRIRENIALHPKEMCTDILDISLSEVLGRTIITTLTTMLAAFALYYFTQGGMKDFAMCLIVGMLSGTYSSIYIASTCIHFISKNKRGEEIFVAKTNPSSDVSV